MAEWICPDCGRGPDEKGVCPCGRYGTDVNVMRADALAARVVTLTARVTALETAGEDLKRDSSAAIEAIGHAIHDPTTWPGIDWSGADVAAKQYEKAVATWDEAMKGAE